VDERSSVFDALLLPSTIPDGEVAVLMDDAAFVDHVPVTVDE
jgi:hypothetical protein